MINYLNNKLESASYISIAADNYDDVDIADPHVKERTATNLLHRTGTKFFRLHYMRTKSIDHISPVMLWIIRMYNTAPDEIIN